MQWVENVAQSNVASPNGLIVYMLNHFFFILLL